MAAFLVSGSTYEPRFTAVSRWCRGVLAREMSTGTQGRESPTGITFRNLKQEGTAVNHRCMERARRALQIGRNSYRFGFCFAELSVPEMSGDGGPSGGPGRSDSEMSETEGGVLGPPCKREAVQREGLVSPYKLSPPGRDPVAYGRRFPPVNVRGARYR